ncbi:hypothetical protein AN1V17_15200 [Vallitalea sediminicola]
MKKLIIAIILLISLSVNPMGVCADNQKQFSDIPNEFWATPSINYLVSIGVIKGFPDGTFQPNFNVHIDAFIKMTVTALGYTDIENGSNYWAQTYIDKAIELGLIVKDQFFDYEEPITREEMSSIIVNAIKNEKKSDTRDLVEDSVKDFSNTSYRYKEDVKDAYALGIITGFPDGTFQPGTYSTRAQASVIIHRMIDKEEREPFEIEQVEPSMPDNDNSNDNGITGTDENNNGAGLDLNTPVEDIHRIEDGKVVYSTEKIMKILKGYPIIENSVSNDFKENNKIFTDQEIELGWYSELSTETENFLETFFTRDYTTLNKENELNKLLWWFQGWWMYRDKEFAPKDFVKLWLNETEKWKVQQDMIFVTDSYRMVYGTDDGKAVRGRMYFKFIKHDNPDNIFYEMDLSIDNLQYGKWYYVDVDVIMFNPASNAPVDWDTATWMLYSFHYLNKVKLVEVQ